MLKRYTSKSRIKKPTYREVAAELKARGVDRSAMHVWRILNKKGGYSKATEKSVNSVYKELTFKKMP